MLTVKFAQYETIHFDCTLDTVHDDDIRASLADSRGQWVGDFKVVKPSNVDELPMNKTHFALVFDTPLTVGQYRANVFFKKGQDWVASDTFVIVIDRSPTNPTLATHTSPNAGSG